MTVRTASPRRYAMCPPEHFAVSYAINPWMDPSRPVDRARALRQWDALRRTYLDLGHSVDVVPPVPGLPDLVFAANGGLVVEGQALGARFAHAERQPEAAVWLDWLATTGGLRKTAVPSAVVEGEGDLLAVGTPTSTRVVLAGYGFRTRRAAHAEAQELLGVPVLSLRLVDPRYYHLDTALAVLDEATIAYHPQAFSDGSREVLQRVFPDAVLASAEDAAVLGLNAVSDGRHVVLAAQAEGLAEQLRRRGYVPVPVDLSELAKAGGGAKCCTLEVRA